MSTGSNGGTKRLRSKKPKRVMNAPFLQALQQPSGQFKLQAYELVGTAEKLQQPQGPLKTEQELQRQQLPPGKSSRPKSKTSGTNTATSAGNPVVVSSTGSTTADAPVGRVPVAPTVSEYYPFYGSPMTDQREEASLILEPSSKAISGNGGTAISTPVSHAILKHGSSTKILFRPESVAIVGANGRAHAQADLIVDYVNPEHRTATDVLKLPFYGGARGQILEIRKNSDGTVVSKILRGDEEDMELKVHQVAEEPPKPAVKEPEPEASAEEEAGGVTQSFGDYLVNIQNAAASLVALQDSVKKTGKLSPDQKKVYTENLEKLGVAAQKLAHIQQADDDHDAIRFLFDSNYETVPSSAAPASGGEAQKKKTSSTKLTFPGFKGKEENKKKEKEEEENVGEEGSGGDSVQVETQEKESSIAEAKPVGLAIAGEGGVASSKPVATAVVGDGGLAVARPVATAIAGIKPSELGSLGLPISLNKKVLTKGKYGLVAASDEAAGGVLVGPDYEARVAPKEIEAEIEDNRQQAMAHFDTEKFLANLRLKTATPTVAPNVPQQLTAYPQPQSYLQQAVPYMSDYGLGQSAYPVYTPIITPYYSWPSTYYPYQSGALGTLTAYQLAALQSAQYNPYTLYGGYQQPQLQQSLAQNPFQQYDYPQRTALYNPSPVVSSPAAAYSNYNNYASFSNPSPYRFFYY
ncbi:AGAP006502-PA-like protein [Anopheles sinensis]|uniref:AGAP006502-PA-like protein n=1 Tax=Anopheles sinensis TaxID=74873 RepID=A0A084W6I2_ANOSI|nr:AGAP006502-PA-like protein [Anopheles sinensis]